jgi:Homeodomain-like domain-containing protein
MYSECVRARAAARLAAGATLSEVSRELGISRSALRAWRDGGRLPRRAGGCPRCDDTGLDEIGYAELLGYYLGDGCISSAPRYFALRVSCDASYRGIIRAVDTSLRRVRPDVRIFHVPAPGTVVVQANWKHWPCLFPQHGPGRKHDRPIVLEDWQRTIVEAHPAELLRGLFHSDGSRVRNWASRVVAGERRRYDYPRWQFTNNSGDIRELCCWALDLVDVAWRQSNWKTISVSRRADVARLDARIGLKR